MGGFVVLENLSWGRERQSRVEDLRRLTRVLAHLMRRFFRGPVRPPLQGFLTRDQHLEATRLMQQVSLETQLRESGAMGDREQMMARAATLGIPFVDLARVKLDASLRSLIPSDLMLSHLVVPVLHRDRTVWLATSDVANLKAIDEIRAATGCRIVPALAEERHIRAQLRDWGILQP